MCDPEGLYYFKNGNEFKGSFRTCSKLTCKYGCFEGPGILQIQGLGVFKGKFKNNKIEGPGKLTFSSGDRAPIEAIWQQTSIE